MKCEGFRLAMRITYINTMEVLMKKIMLMASMIGLMALSPVSYAQDTLDNLSFKERHERIKAMSPEERQAFFKARKEQWDAMSKEEKLKVIEERRAKRMQFMEEHWKTMSDDEKIAHVEKKMERRAKWGGKGKHCGDHKVDAKPAE
jgi:hypothetical protein